MNLTLFGPGAILSGTSVVTVDQNFQDTQKFGIFLIEVLSGLHIVIPLI